jgi:hypothetical protein
MGTVLHKKGRHVLGTIQANVAIHPCSHLASAETSSENYETEFGRAVLDVSETSHDQCKSTLGNQKRFELKI